MTFYETLVLLVLEFSQGQCLTKTQNGSAPSKLKRLKKVPARRSSTPQLDLSFEKIYKLTQYISYGGVTVGPAWGSHRSVRVELESLTKSQKLSLA